METIVVTKKQIDNLVVDVEIAMSDLSDVDNDIQVATNLDELDNIPLDIIDIQSSMSVIIQEMKGLQKDALTSHELSTSGESQSVRVVRKQESKEALLSALNSLQAVQGHDGTNQQKSNKTKIPISSSDLQTIQSVLGAAIELHGVAADTPHAWTALSELHKFIKLTYENIKALSATGAAAGIIYAILEAMNLAIEKLGALLQSVQTVIV